MILVVTLNPALDVTYDMPGVDWAGVNRPAVTRARAGGKGLNVARTLRAIGADVQVTGLAGGVAGEQLLSALGELGMPASFTRIGGETRRTFAVVDTVHGSTALFNEPGPRVGQDEYTEFCVRYEKALAGCAAVVLSGSLPPGLPPGTYAELGSMAAAAGVPALLDAHGEALLRGAAARPAIVKPNLAELEALAGRSLSTARGADHGAVALAVRKLMAAGPQAVVVTLGAGGLWAVTGDGSWRAVPPADVSGNPTGAGDAVAAGLVHGLVLGRPWAERLRHAAALGAATAAAPVAGEFSQADYAQALAGISVSRGEAL
ncbi:MAG TPA: 1-phosphofructokinase family hexose kinase [Streptosporangiaceae bacterium]|nr:1-phosphofructokinase family hexose kinase [Streptosporangiaceae bacterium]